MNTQAWIEALGWTLVHSLWQGALVAALLWLVLQTSRRAQPQFRYLAGCAALLLLVFLSAGALIREASRVRFDDSAAAPVATSNALPIRPATPIAPSEFPPPLLTATPREPSTFTSESATIPPAPAVWSSLKSRVQRFLPWIVFAWCAGVLLCFLRLCRGWNTVQKLRRSGHPLDPQHWRVSLDRLAKQLQVSRPVRLVASAAVRVPMVIGWIKPVVLLPCRLVTGLPQEQVEAIIAHEFAHIRRHDYLVNLLQNVIEILFFFHPAVWWISARIRQERELCCDDLAAAAIGGALPYVKALTALEESRCVEESLAVAITSHSLVSRVRRLLTPSPAEGPGGTTLLTVCALLVIIVTLGLPLALGQKPKPESTPPSSTPPPDASASSEENLGPVAALGKHAQTRKLLRLWQTEFRSKPQFFAVSMNSNVQRKPGSSVREPKEVVFEELQALEIPAEAFQRLARYVEKSIPRFPGENDAKLRALLPRIQADQPRTLQETANLIDEVCDLSKIPVTQLAIDEQFRAFGRLKPGEPLPPALLDQLPFGPVSAKGLRAAWIFRPMQEDYALGDALASRIIIHNAGKDPAEFMSDAWHQDAEWFVTNAANAAVKLMKIPFRHSEDVHRSRLAPGEAVELRGPALGIGMGEFDEIYGDRIGMKLPARVGDEFRLNWTIKLQAAWAQSDDPAIATPAPVKLTTGPVKLRIVARDTNGPKPVFIATTPGKYILGPGTNLRIDRIRLMGMGTINGVRDESTSKISENNWAHLEVAENRSKSISVRLPQGDNSYVIAWERGGGAIWIGEADSVRKLEISTAGRFPAAEVLASIDPLRREEVAAFLNNAGTGIPEKRWKWEDPGDFGGIPPQVKSALVQHRPKGTEQPVVPEDSPRYPVEPANPTPDFVSSTSLWNANRFDEKIILVGSGQLVAPGQKTLASAPAATNEVAARPWAASGQVTDGSGKPMPGVEIWVHAGSGSLHRTGIATTGTDGRYKVEFGPGILMGDGSSQLQIANITAHRPGFFEKNLSRHGQGAAATREVSAEDLKSYSVTSDQLTLPNRPRQVDFVMLRGATIKGRLVGTGSFPTLPPQDYRNKEGEKLIAGHIQHNRAPLARWQVWLTGKQLSPGTSVFATAETDHEGRFEFKDVPVGFDWQIEVDTHRRGAAARTPLFKPRSTAESATDLEYIIEENAVKFLAPARKGAGPVVPPNNQGNIQFIEGESGRPIPNAALSVLFLSADPVTPPPLQMTADAEGVARIEVRRSRTATLAPNVPDRWSSNSIVLGEGAQNGGALTPPSRPGGPMQIALWKGTKVTGRLLLPDGSPLRGAPLSVEAYVSNEEWKKRLVPDRSTSVNWSKLTKTREDGTFAITVPPAEARTSLRIFSPEIAFGVTAPPETKAALAKCAPFHAADGGPDGKSTERQGVLDFGERKLLSGIVVRGRVEDSGGKPMPGIGVSLLYNPRTGISRITRSDADGSFAFPPMPPGEVTIHADPRLLVEGRLPNPPAEAVFVRQALTLREGTASVDVVARAVPVIALEFEWIDRRTKKGEPMSAFGSFPVSGSVRDSKGELQPWRGYLEKTKRDGKEFLFAKIPAQIIDPALQLLADSWVTARYEDDSTSSGPGTFAIRDHATPKRRIIYGDDPQPGR